jgi:hypothetical protein
LKSPQNPEWSRIIDFASHIHRSQFRFSNSFGCFFRSSLEE